MKTRPPRVRYREFGDSGIHLDLLCWIGAPALRGRGTHEVLKSVYGTLQQADVDLPFPQREVHFRASDEQRAAARPTDPPDETDTAAD